MRLTYPLWKSSRVGHMHAPFVYYWERKSPAKVYIISASEHFCGAFIRAFFTLGMVAKILDRTGEMHVAILDWAENLVPGLSSHYFLHYFLDFVPLSALLPHHPPTNSIPCFVTLGLFCFHILIFRTNERLYTNKYTTYSQPNLASSILTPSPQRTTGLFPFSPYLWVADSCVFLLLPLLQLADMRCHSVAPLFYLYFPQTLMDGTWK